MLENKSNEIIRNKKSQPHENVKVWIETIHTYTQLSESFESDVTLSLLPGDHFLENEFFWLSYDKWIKKKDQSHTSNLCSERLSYFGTARTHTHRVPQQVSGGQTGVHGDKSTKQKSWQGRRLSLSLSLSHQLTHSLYTHTHRCSGQKHAVSVNILGTLVSNNWIFTFRTEDWRHVHLLSSAGDARTLTVTVSKEEQCERQSCLSAKVKLIPQSNVLTERHRNNTRTCLQPYVGSEFSNVTTRVVLRPPAATVKMHLIQIISFTATTATPIPPRWSVKSESGRF